MQRLNQQYEAQVFIQKNAVQIADAEAMLYAKAIELLSCEGQKTLQPGTISNAGDAITRKQLPRLFSILRQQAVYFRGSDRYWAWIDATGFLMDATGQQWPYITQERRAQYLSWVHCVLQERFTRAA